MLILDLDKPEALELFNHTDIFIQPLLLALGQHFALKDFVETGTCTGNTLDAVHKGFSRIFSIEIKESFWLHAKKRFAGMSHISLFLGSSGNTLASILKNFNVFRALFWLDAHMESGTTLEYDQLPKEFLAIEQYAPDSLVVVDDVVKTPEGYRINYTYPFMIPKGWRGIYVHNMNIAVLHRGNFALPKAFWCYEAA